MKINLLLLVMIVLNQSNSISQSQSYSFSFLNSNNVNAQVSTNDVFFNDLFTSSGQYQVSSNQTQNVIYSSSFWFGAENINGNRFVCAQKYGNNQDMFCGPIASDYTTADYLANYNFGIWSTSQSDINTHLQNYNTANYVVPNQISNWPAHGDVSNGEGANLAPFVDVNHNGIYDPINGDYPNIRGDRAIYMILNDGAGLHTESGGDPLGMEFHFMLYQYATNDNIDNTTFINLKVINRSTQTYYNFKAGQFTDSDIGDATDDYFGCDSLKNMIYTYNGDNLDNGFGAAPPAVGIKLLNKKMDVAGYFNSGGVIQNQNEPVIATDYWGYMNAEWKSSGMHFTEGGSGYGGTVSTNYLMSSNPNNTNGWSEETEMNAPEDRKMFMSSTGITMAPNDEVCYDYAVVYARGNSNLNSVDSLLQVADEIQDFYDNQAFYTCESVVLSTENSKIKNQLNLFPNPGDGLFNLEGLTVDSEVYLYTMDGKLLKVIGYNSESSIQFDISTYKSGNYLLKVVNDEDIIMRKISIK
jgi:hypothetical protein